ncbi:oligosaccharide flippase family protein [Bacillus thuringiensis]|uniref:oligosaccharide flippase family protein n=1 Tax=Bacillus thuringiensis TaxID=1428 RepID=UPI001FB5B902|nr:oligosaccharide flippase family protein [Bacillus thuringiensis]
MLESNSKLFKKSFKNILYSFSAQGIALILSITRVLLIPKIIGIEEYSYWQLFLFWIGYVGFFHFGFNDGILLKYGGRKYSDLDNKLLRSQFIILLISQIIVAALIVICTSLYSVEEERIFIGYSVALSLVINNICGFYWCILQSTNRFKEYSRAVTIDKFIFLFCIILMMIVNVRDFKVYVIVYLITTIISLIYTLYTCRDLIVGKLSSFQESIKEAYNNVSIGMKLMIANVASMLILGAGRFIIDRFWGIETFGKISLALSITSMVLLFINAISIVLFPALRQVSKERLVETYIVLRTLLMYLLAGLLVLYIPIQYVLNLWLPKYTESLKYLAILFPLCIFEGKMQMLISTYLKVFRRESVLLIINIVSVSISVLLSVIAAMVFNSVLFVIISMVLGVLIRCLIAEIYLSKILNVNLIKGFIYDFILTSIFMISSWYLQGVKSFFVYSTAYLILVFYGRNNIRYAFNSIKKL